MYYFPIAAQHHDCSIIFSKISNILFCQMLFFIVALSNLFEKFPIETKEYIGCLVRSKPSRFFKQKSDKNTSF